MKEYYISAIDYVGGYHSKEVKYKKKADKYIKQFCKEYGECNLFIWEDGKIIYSETFKR